LRAGTQNVAAIVGMAEAARITVAERQSLVRHVDALAAEFVESIVAAVDGAFVAVPADRRIGAICNIGFAGVESEELLILLDRAGVYASAGSSCASGALEASHVLVAMGRTEAEARSHVRFSLGRSTTQAQVVEAAGAVAGAVARLRAAS
jgi:cysteine desulfurase